MRFSLRLNNDLPITQHIALAQLAEQVGFDQYWVSHDLFLRSSLVILAGIAQATQRIQIGSGILNPYTMNPAEIAMFAASMDELSGNRFNLGLAAGAGEFLKWIGLEQGKTVAMMRETISVIRSLLRGERVALDGQYLHWTNEAYLRTPAPRVTPIYLGAMSPNMLKLAGDHCDGVLPLLFPPENFTTVHNLVTSSPHHPSASSSPFDFAACIWISLDEDRAAARKELAKKIAYYGHALSPLIYERLGVTREDFRPIEHALMVERDEEKAAAMVDDRMLRIGVVGDVDEVVARLKSLIALGATHISFGPPLGPDPRKAIELLGKKVLPQLA